MIVLNPLDLSGRAILVTGASSGIGRETAILLSRLGARLILVARDAERLGQTRNVLEGSDHWVEPFDLIKTDEIPAWMETLARKTGPLAGLVHAAGVQQTAPLKTVDPADIDAIMRINVTAAAMLVKGFRQRSVRASSGSVVLVASVMGLVSEAGMSAYSASKGALVSLARSLSLELAHERIRVNCVAPACVQTPLFDRMKKAFTPAQISAITTAHPLGLGRPIDVAYAAAYLLADTAAWVTGSTLVVDGGYTAR